MADITSLVIQEALARAVVQRGQSDWSHASSTVRRLGSQLAALFSEVELRDGLRRLGRHGSLDDAARRAVVLLELAAILQRAELSFG